LWVANLVAFNGDVMRELAVQFLALADQQRATGPLMVGHRLMGLSLIHTGDIADGRAHLDRAIGLYDPTEHRPLATRFGQDIGAAILCWKSLAFWLLGYPEAALTDTEHALKFARDIGHSATLMYVLNFSTWTHIHCGNYAAANALIEEFVVLKDQTGSSFWSAWGMMQQGCLWALTGKTSNAVQMITSGVTAMRLTGTTMWMPVWLACLAKGNAQIGQFNNARQCIDEAMKVIETTKERWYEAEVNCIAGEIALMLPEPDAANAEIRFERALAVARQQQAKSWELRAAMNMARLWRDQGKRQQAHDLLAPVYGWFTEGLDTLDLKEAKALLSDLSS
jgi:predicted ATPase